MRNCSFKYPSEALLREDRALTAPEYELMLPKTLLRYVDNTPKGLPIPERVANGARATTYENRFPVRLPRASYTAPDTIDPVIGRLAAEDGIEPYMAQLTPTWLPGADSLTDGQYAEIKAEVLKHESIYSELASRYLVARVLGARAFDALEQRPPKPWTGYVFNKYVADTLKEHLPGICQAWAYMEHVHRAEAEEGGRKGQYRIDWKELQKTYGPLRLS